MQLLKSGLEVITVNDDLPNGRFQDFISQLTLEDLCLTSYFNSTSTETDVKPDIKLANTTAGRQLLNSIDRELSILVAVRCAMRHA